MTSLPPSRGRWRLTLHRRDYSGTATPRATGLAELTDARSRKIETKANDSSTLTFTLDGRSQSAAYVAELTTDVMAWRWDDTLGADRLMGRFVVAQTEDQVTQQDYSLNVTCHDYFAMLGRRFLTPPADLVYSATDQDDIVADLLARATTGQSSGSGTSFTPGSALPLTLALVNPDGTTRGKSGVVRDRTYSGQSVIGDLISNLAAVIGAGGPGTTAFDFDVFPHSDVSGSDQLRLFFPARGVTRTDLVLQFPATVSAFTRTVNSADYGNYQRVIGDNSAAGVGAPQLYAEAWNADANNVGAVPIGLWMSGSNQSDVNQLATLQQTAQGDLAVSGVLMPHYSLTMRPGAVVPGTPNIGDTVGLVLQVGRLAVNTTVRVLGITWDIGDDGEEDTELTVGRPALDLTALFIETNRDVAALARR